MGARVFAHPWLGREWGPGGHELDGDHPRRRPSHPTPGAPKRNAATAAGDLCPHPRCSAMQLTVPLLSEFGGPDHGSRHAKPASASPHRTKKRCRISMACCPAVMSPPTFPCVTRTAPKPGSQAAFARCGRGKVVGAARFGRRARDIQGGAQPECTKVPVPMPGARASRAPGTRGTRGTPANMASPRSVWQHSVGRRP